jgi:hypothetical protein
MDTGEVLYYFTYEQSNHVYKEDLLLPHEACYRFTVYDAAGEGMGGGFFQVKDSNGTVVFKGGNSAGRFTYELATELQCDGFVDVEENSSSAVLEAICVAPNPTTGIVNLDLGKGEWHIQMFDITGRKVMEHQCEGSSSLDLSQQQKGLYLLKAQNVTEEYNTIIVLR